MKNRVYLVTGATSGIGRALALRAAQAGDIVFAGVRELSRAPSSENIRPIQLDVTNPEDVHRASETILQECGSIDVLVNNAGFGVYGAFEELSEEQIRAQMETNYFGCLAMARAVLPSMRARRSGTIINVSSILGRITIPTGSAYTASKYAIEAFTESLRQEVRPFGIQVFAVEPGLIRTSFKQNMVKSHAVQKSDSPYAFLNRMIQKEYNGFSTSHERAADRIYKLSQKKSPARRYRVGLDASFYYTLSRILPDSLLDNLVALGVRREFKKTS